MSTEVFFMLALLLSEAIEKSEFRWIQRFKGSSVQRFCSTQTSWKLCSVEHFSSLKDGSAELVKVWIVSTHQQMALMASCQILGLTFAPSMPSP
jgi:hypothetical protein